MRVFGIILVVVGILMFVFNGFNYQTEKTVLDVGPVKVDKKENRHVGWPMYAGGLALVGGIALLIAGGKKK